MKTRSVFIYCTSGTYGRDDDAYGAVLLANHAVARSMTVTMVLAEDGAVMGMKKQNPGKIGLPNNFTELQDFLELGGRLVIIKESLEQRGISKEEIIDGAEILPFLDIINVMDQHDISVTF
jgi:predicted peroxiredoxin